MKFSLLPLLFLSLMAFAHPGQRPQPPSANPGLCEYLLRQKDPTAYMNALFPNFGPSLFELFPYDLLAREDNHLQPFYAERMSWPQLLETLPEMRDDSNMSPSEAGHRRFGYRWKPDPRVIDESPVVLLPGEVQRLVLGQYIRHLAGRPGRHVQFLRARAEYLYKKSLFTNYTLGDPAMSPGQRELQIKSVPPALWDDVGRGLSPMASPYAELAWRAFWTEKVIPRSPLTAAEYLHLLGLYVEIVPL